MVALEKLLKLRSPKRTEKKYTVLVPFYLSSKAITDSIVDRIQWIKNTLTKEGKVVNQKKQKYNFRRDDFLKVVSSM